MKHLSIGKVDSEFEIQAWLFCELRIAGARVRGEVRCHIGHVGMRFDLIVFDGEDAPIYVIEVKPPRGKGWRDMWIRTGQAKMYASLPIPVFMVCGQKQAAEFIALTEQMPTFCRTGSGIIWHESWSRQST